MTSLRSERAAIEKKLERLQGRPIVGYHRSLAYLAQVGSGWSWSSPSNQKPGIRRTRGTWRKWWISPDHRKVACLLQEAWWPTSTSAPAAEKIGVPLIVIPGMTNFRRGEPAGFLGAIAAKLEKVPRATLRCSRPGSLSIGRRGRPLPAFDLSASGREDMERSSAATAREKRPGSRRCSA